MSAHSNGKRGRGAPTKYDAVRHPALVAALAAHGHVEAEIARLLCVSLTTLKTWKAKHLEFLTALKGGKDLVDRQVEHSLLQRALGYEYEEETVIARRVPKGRPGEYTESVAEIKREKKRWPPNTTAQIFWLVNRSPQRWRDVRSVVVEGGAKPLGIEVAPATAQEGLAMVKEALARARESVGREGPEHGTGGES